MKIVIVSKTITFEAAHQLPNYIGKCANLHGHTYRVRATISGQFDQRTPAGIIVDFGIVKDVLNKAIFNRYDHQNLNDHFELPSAETMVHKMFDDVKQELQANELQINLTEGRIPKLTLLALRLWEGGGDNWAEVRES